MPIRILLTAGGLLCACAVLPACAGLTANRRPDVRPVGQVVADSGPNDQQQLPPESQERRVTPEPRPNYVLPPIEIIGFEALVNFAGRHGPEADAYRVTPESIRRNLEGPWVIDNDPFAVNQFLHPYQGAIYHTISRSSGLNYWQSLAMTFAASAMWEIAGETTKPALNDQLASGVAGTFLGESLFRSANLLLARADQGDVSFARGLLAALISPPTGLNRTVFGKRFDALMPTRDPAYDLRVQFGASNTRQPVPGGSLNEGSAGAVGDILMEYGLPGQAGYSFTRPFDYFRIDATVSTTTQLEKVTSHGVIVGRRYEAGDGSGGVWGVYGIYDYLAPLFFRVSTTAISGGTTIERWAGPQVLLQATLLGGVGYAAVQTTNGTDERDYHYGMTPQAVETFRLVAADRVSFDLSARQYFVTAVAGFDTPGTDTILRAEASGTVKIYKRNGVTVRYTTTRRTAEFPGFGPQKQSIDTISVLYTMLGPQRLGAVKR